MNDVQDWWLSRFDLPPAQPTPPAGPDTIVSWFPQVRVWVEFDSPDLNRRLVATTLPGHVGRWVLAYSSYERFTEIHRGEDAEYSMLRGETLLAILPPYTGIWLDPGHPDGCTILFPQAMPVFEDVTNEGA